MHHVKPCPSFSKGLRSPSVEAQALYRFRGHGAAAIQPSLCRHKFVTAKKVGARLGRADNNL